MHRMNVVTYEGSPRDGVPTYVQVACDCGWFQERGEMARDAFRAYANHLPVATPIQWAFDMDSAHLVAYHLRDASSAMARSHAFASEEGGLTGYVRDLLYGLTSAVDALLGMVEQVAEADAPPVATAPPDSPPMWDGGPDV